MKRYLYLALGLFLAAVLIQAGQDSGSRTLEVKVRYTGPGTVDDGHPIAVALWENDEFMRSNDVRPLLVKLVRSNGGKATFPDVSKSPVYVSAAYDPNGKWDAMSGPPPTGSPLGMYSKGGMKPEPINIESGGKRTVEFTFDDTVKMK